MDFIRRQYKRVRPNPYAQ